MTEPIAVGILLDSEYIPAWQRHLIKLLCEIRFVRLDIFLVRSPNAKPNCTHFARFLLEKLSRLDHNPGKPDIDACRNHNVVQLSKELGSSLHVIERHSDNLRNDTHILDKIRRQKLDVIVMLGALPMLDAASRITKYGAWYFQHDYGQTGAPDGSTVGIWEVLKRRPWIRSSLIIRTVDGSDHVAYDTHSAIHKTSFFRSRNEHLWKILFFVPRTLKRFFSGDSTSCLNELARSVSVSVEPLSPRRWKLNGPNLLPRVAFYAIWRVCNAIGNRTLKRRWILMYSSDEDTSDLTRYMPILPPHGRFWADPFIAKRNDVFFIFFEDASVATGIGHIAVISKKIGGECSPATKVLEKPYHLSYPFIFEWGDDTYMIPETAENQSIELYRCTDFPHKWEFVHNLIDGVVAYDATLIDYDDHWWMFANVKCHEEASTWDELHLFFSDSPLSRDWAPHPLNPIVSDVRTARPAGHLYWKSGNLYRPSQDSSHRYGYGININRVVTLTTNLYEEEVVKTIRPERSFSMGGVHSMNHVDQMVVIDALSSYRARELR